MAFFHPPSASSSRLSYLQRLKHLDLGGLALFFPSVLMLLLAIQWGGNTHPWNSSTVIGLFCGSAATLVLFGVWELHQGDEASIPPSIIKRRSVLSASAISLFSMGALQLSAYYLPIYFQVIKDVTPLESGIRILPSVLSNVLASIISGLLGEWNLHLNHCQCIILRFLLLTVPLVIRLGYFTPFIFLAAILITISGGLLSTLKTDTGSPEWIGYQVIIGTGAGMIIQMVQSPHPSSISLSTMPHLLQLVHTLRTSSASSSSNGISPTYSSLTRNLRRSILPIFRRRHLPHYRAKHLLNPAYQITCEHRSSCRPTSYHQSRRSGCAICCEQRELAGCARVVQLCY